MADQISAQRAAFECPPSPPSRPRLRWALFLLLALLLPLGCDFTEPTAGSAPGRGVPPRGSGTTHASKPNVVLITIDTLRADALGAYGQRRSTSKQLDRLAAEGVLFEDVTSASPETLPSHASIFTATNPYLHGVRSNAQHRLAEQNLTLAEVLAEHGYRTGAEVAAAVLHEKTRIAQGFESFRGVDSPGVELKKVVLGDGRQVTKPIRSASGITSGGLDFVAKESGTPFFLWLHYFDPHQPYLAPYPYRQAIPDSAYHAEVAYVDAEVGRFVAGLRARGLGGNTLLVVTADHGEGLREHGEVTHAFFVYQTTMRVPLLLWQPGNLPAGRRIAQAVRTIDIAPTILDLLALSPLPRAEGTSLLPLLENGSIASSLVAYGEATSLMRLFGTPPIRMIREGRWKYIHKVNPELYDLRVDPDEELNRAARDTEEVARLRAKLERALANVNGSPAGHGLEISPIDSQRLESLGYLIAGEPVIVSDELGALTLEGEDPAARIGDVETISIAKGMVEGGQFLAAIEHIAPLFERDPGNTFVRDVVIDALIGLRRYEQVLPMLRAVVEEAPDNLARRGALADALGALGSHSEAAAVLRRAPATATCESAIVVRLVATLRILRGYAELVDLLSERSRQCPHEPLFMNEHAWALATLPARDLRDGQKALEVARLAIELLGRQDPNYLDTLAAAHAEIGEYPEAARLEAEVLDALRASGTAPGVLRVFESHLAAFEAGEPIRDPGG